MKVYTYIITGILIHLIIYATVASTLYNIRIVEEENSFSYQLWEEKIPLLVPFDFLQGENTLEFKKQKLEDVYLLKAYSIVYFEVVIPPPE